MRTISREQYRILRAARNDKLLRDETSFRWYIAGGAKPDPKDVQALLVRELIEVMTDYFEAWLTEKGWTALAELDKTFYQREAA